MGAGSTVQLPLFQGNRDFEYLERVNREFYLKCVVEVEVFLYDRNQADPLYGDDNDKSFNRATTEPSYLLPMFFPALDDWRATLTKHGQDEARPLKGFVYDGIFVERSIQAPEDGDHIFIEAERMKIIDFDPSDNYFGNTFRNLTYSVTLQRARLESIEQKPRLVEVDDLYPATVFQPDPRKAPLQTEAPAPHRGPVRNPFED